MRILTSLLLLTGLAETAMAHTRDGLLSEALSHQLLGLHHLPFTILLLVVAVFAIYRWYSRKSVD